MNDEVMERLIDTLMELQKKESTDLPLLKKQLASKELTGTRTSGGACGLIRSNAKNLTKS